MAPKNTESEDAEGSIARRTDNGAASDQTAIGIARDGLADKSLIERKPNSGSARLSWARENSKHRRTATRQQGFCRSVLKQFPLDFSQTGVLLEDRFFEIVAKRTALQAPGKSTEPIKFRASCEVCQICCAKPAISVGCGDVNGLWRNHQQMALSEVGQRIDLVAFADAHGAAALQKERH